MKPSESAVLDGATLTAANEATMPRGAGHPARDETRHSGWDPYDVWRTRVKPSKPGAPAGKL